MSNIQWSFQDQLEALSDGWGMFFLDENPKELMIQRNDESGKFDNDIEAIVHVLWKGYRGDALAKKALEIISSPEEEAHEHKGTQG